MYDLSHSKVVLCPSAIRQQAPEVAQNMLPVLNVNNVVNPNKLLIKTDWTNCISYPTRHICIYFI